ncbi:MAG: hypothetical protein ABIH03_12185 [Pseudomonadota bacterium]
MLGAFVLAFADAALLRKVRGPALAERKALVARLGLTDLCLFTEARYTRHPSQADLHSAFQDHPFALEHFPTGSLLSPPASLMQNLEASRGLAESPPRFAIPRIPPGKP